MRWHDARDRDGLTAVLAVSLPWALAAAWWRRRDVISACLRREVHGRFRGSVLGLGWMVLAPAAMLAAAMLVFGVIFPARWPMADPAWGLAGVAVALCAGQIAFAVVADPLGRAPLAIAGVPHLVKKVVFPVEILPLVQVIGGLIQAGIAGSILTAVAWWVMGAPPWAMLAFPALILPLALWALAAAWLVAGLGVFVRDLAPAMALGLHLLLFATPVFYPVEALPEALRPFMDWHPLAAPVVWVRAAALGGGVPGAWDYGVALVPALVAVCLSHAGFQLVRRRFADAL
jgi:lipopolysaccharide transport system permease protein